jgi:hypothetical protein
LVVLWFVGGSLIKAIAAVTWAQQLAAQDQRLADMLTMPWVSHWLDKAEFAKMFEAVINKQLDLLKAEQH